jgi:hypothetical protein
VALNMSVCRSIGHVLLLDDAANLRLEAHVEHAVGLVENEELDARQRDAAALNHVDEAAGRGDNHVGAAVELAHLKAGVGAAVDDDGAQRRAVAELARLVPDLRRELASRRENQHARIRAAAAAAVATAAPRGPGAAAA